MAHEWQYVVLSRSSEASSPSRRLLRSVAETASKTMDDDVSRIQKLFILSLDEEVKASKNLLRCSEAEESSG